MKRIMKCKTTVALSVKWSEYNILTVCIKSVKFRKRAVEGVRDRC